MQPTIELVPNTKRLKQVIKEFGRIWNVVSSPEPMQCFDGGIGISIESLDGKHFRNIRLEDILDEF